MYFKNTKNVKCFTFIILQSINASYNSCSGLTLETQPRTPKQAWRVYRFTSCTKTQAHSSVSGKQKSPGQICQLWPSSLHRLLAADRADPSPLKDRYFRLHRASGQTPLFAPPSFNNENNKDNNRENSINKKTTPTKTTIDTPGQADQHPSLMIFSPSSCNNEKNNSKDNDNKENDNIDKDYKDKDYKDKDTTHCFFSPSLTFYSISLLFLSFFTPSIHSCSFIVH